MPLAGTLVEGRYRLVRPVGHGASSVVYFAVGTDGLPYAVKVFPAELMARAERELSHSPALTHARITPVLTRTEVQGLPALVLGFARGRVLFDRYTRRPALTQERRAFLLTLAHVLEALGHLHAQGIVHRDVKPENIIVDTDGSAKVVDFDLSGPINEAFSTPLRIGTAAFQSPEAVRGEPLGPESDLYGVGVLLHWGMYGALLDEEGAGPLPETRDPLEGLRRTLLEPDRFARPSRALDVRRQLLSLASLPY
ncbi:serine/threonine-protein kinase [Deinococcus maricopensis]|uniref:Serine/threonine protein kinase n=1 Tax=Deinococcus maricopensis (strain DSM 21211 / LMG 22137 / NRRL B-23946 / LB-34) TaxID=709986 RepID=E8UBG3_DEIML|nr:serine/threonine-protein kinase [Deinococcus maricopensis]ADV68402.1 serine/threonine protein kinase [Deinococcus maricopensis DSM 21211]